MAAAASLSLSDLAGSDGVVLVSSTISIGMPIGINELIILFLIVIDP